ncbi:MAG: MurR/RpiR family transcriptional regulator [Enterococcus hirae]|uniref:MurR/RpiR family transcriptional regulator n=1 Tax=Enterococcus hirae TaxID=1354 RepID=UPI00055700E2|nr:MurR/RpiR family transcriptional regulator [Enterococcus hirae]OWW69977.1 RpiR family transcriptional regulator [Enterococcus hirae 57-09-G6]EMF0044242.1 MurR/RpiR family transcriptional regulator [Enterococcus hirae]EMF0119514.1 MurR/RpiR family transcriptional regulator [Enterococcus hirae]EMF0440926.1 MurR/RpiR family transcriptional regulator [Enterococcus hirae]KNB93459.1 RpiR family transcriptional regulator [Enterococcus hirae]
MENKLSESEQFLWRFIEAHILDIPDYSIIKLSELANVSTATIVRTMKKKGYEGFTSFKHHLKEKGNQTINFSTLEKVDRGIRKAILKNEEEVTRTINMIEIGNIEDAIQKIKVARRIIIFVRGFSELIAQEMMVKFQLAGKYCELHTDPEIIKNISKTLHKEDIAIFVSLNGETSELVVAAQNCYNAEIGTVLLTANQYSSMMQFIEIAFVGFKSEGSFFPDYEVRSRLPLSILARILLDAYALRTSE